MSSTPRLLRRDNASETTALDMLGLAIPAQLRQAYGRARELLRDALIHNAPHPRPKSKLNTGRGTSAAVTGRSSWMQASRLNTIEHCPFAHFEQAKSIGHPQARDRAGRELPPDIEQAIKFALSHGDHKMAAFRQRQMSVVVVCVYYKYKYCKWWTLGAPGRATGI